MGGTFVHVFVYSNIHCIVLQSYNIPYLGPSVLFGLVPLDVVEALDAILAAHRVQRAVQHRHAHGRPAGGRRRHRPAPLQSIQC